MTGRQVKAEEALSIGIADKVVPDDELLDVAMNDAAAFALGPTQAYTAVKRAVSRGFDQPLEEGLAIEAEQFARAFASNDAKVGVAAFLSKEKPDFSGT